MQRILLIAVACASIAGAQTDDPAAKQAAGVLTRAYEALRAKSFDRAVELFQTAEKLAPSRADIRKDLAYAYLKVGDTERARDEFAEAAKLNPKDEQAELEYAFLCNETGRKAEARRTFDRLQRAGNATARQAFQNIDAPLGEEMDRWSKALQLSPGNFSAHREMARLAENRDDLPRAAEHYRAAWELRPQEASLLVDLGRIWTAQGRTADAASALLAASRRGGARVAESARELLPPRYPYVYEFRGAIALDPKNIELRRELAYLHLEMGKREEAEREFRQLLEIAPDDPLSTAQLGFLLLDRDDVAGAMPLLEKAVKSSNKEVVDRVRAALRVPADARKRKALQAGDTRKPAAPAGGDDPKTLGDKSLRAGYLKDALKYLKLAHELDPNDYAVVLKLGWANNMLHDDKQAMEWFALARKSSDAAIATEASAAYKNLRPSQETFRTTAWVMPFYSSRWKDTFAYGQVKTELKVGNLPIRPYLSTRIIGDLRNTTPGATPLAQPQYLSESSVIFALGAATSSYKGLTAWAEAGEALRYRDRKDIGLLTPDYRGGVSYGHALGHQIGGEGWGLFFETNDDGVFLSRFQHDTLFYSQNKIGVTLPALAGFQSQLYWNSNATVDLKKQYWANFYEMGPGVRFRFAAMPQSLSFTVNGLRGNYLINEGNPRGPRFYDFRAGFWYAFTH